MKALFDESGTVEGLEKLIQEAIFKNAKGIMLLACDANGFTPVGIDRVLQECKVPIFGGIFPEIIFENKKYDRGSALLILDNHEVNIQILENLSEATTDIGVELQNHETADFKTMFVYVDAFSTSIETMVNEIYYEFGLESNFIGGGAGSLSFVQKPVIVTNKGLLQDAAVLATVQYASSIGVKHGWYKIEGPFQITKSNKNVIEELDYRPAFEVYKQKVENHSDKRFDGENFFEIAKGYPFGISKLGSEHIVRDPISVVNDAMVCVGNVKNGDYLDILSGDVDTLVTASHQAVEEASKAGAEYDLVFFIDCISRVLFLQENFQKELDGISASTKNMLGALTLGEIANTGKNYLEFYNKTAVVGVF